MSSKNTLDGKAKKVLDKLSGTENEDQLLSLYGRLCSLVTKPVADKHICDNVHAAISAAHDARFKRSKRTAAQQREVLTA